MALSPCNTSVDRHGRELVQHGTPAFPIACYHDDFSRQNLPWHWHEELELAILTEGTAVMAAGNEKYTLQVGEGIFVNSGVLHAAWDVDHSKCRFHSVVFHPRLVGGSLDSIFYRDYAAPLAQNKSLECLFLSPGIPWQKRILDAIEEAWQLCLKEPPAYEFGTRNAMSQIVFELVCHMPAAQPPTGSKAARDAQRIKVMLAFIHENFATELSTGRIAASAMISESECLRCFHSTIGTSPIQYLKQYRIQQAAELLLTSQDKVADIASNCGFQDMSYFTRSFRELKGCTPTQYRQIKL